MASYEEMSKTLVIGKAPPPPLEEQQRIAAEAQARNDAYWADLRAKADARRAIEAAANQERQQRLEQDMAALENLKHSSEERTQEALEKKTAKKSPRAKGVAAPKAKHERAARPSRNEVIQRRWGVGSDNRFLGVPDLYRSSRKSLGIDPVEHAVIEELFHYLGDNQFCHPGVRTIAFSINCNKDTVNAALLRLEKRGLITIERKAHCGNRYRLDGLKAELSARESKTVTTPEPTEPDGG